MKTLLWRSDFVLVKRSFTEDRVKELEEWIDLLDSQLPTLKNFILPSGGFSSSFLHVARSVCRRAERVVWPMVESGDMEKSIGMYLNRYVIMHAVNLQYNLL